MDHFPPILASFYPHYPYSCTVLPLITPTLASFYPLLPLLLLSSTPHYPYPCILLPLKIAHHYPQLLHRITPNYPPKCCKSFEGNCLESPNITPQSYIFFGVRIRHGTEILNGLYAKY